MTAWGYFPNLPRVQGDEYSELLSSESMSTAATIVVSDRPSEVGLEKATSAPAIAWLPQAHLAAVVAQFALLVLVVVRFKLESAPFHDVLKLALGGMIVHHLTPLKYRISVFLALSIIALFMLLGAEPLGWSVAKAFARGGVLIAFAVSIVLIARLRLNLWIKVGGIAAVGLLVGVFRSGFIAPPFLAPVWPILAAMFMFRVIVYLYDLEHEKQPPTFVRSMAYFLMLPNACFPLFPVVDSKAFGRNYYNEPAALIYQKGLNWMTRGIIQLVLYRAIYFYLYIDAARVTSGADIVRFLVTNLLLYLRVSGQFHLVIGLLHLFGFNLPETNRRYLLASSFTDYWRRVNIYWKDFILKVFYNPTYFRLKKNPTRALVLATLYCFLITWALHSYQWYWIRGSFPITAQDLIFWGVLGVLVIVNSLWEARRGRARVLVKKARTVGEMASLGLRTAGTFASLAVLWSIWSADSMAVWRHMWVMADSTTVALGLAVLFVVATAAVGIDAWDALLRWLCGNGPTGVGNFSFRQATVLCLLPAAVLYAMTSGRLHSHLGAAGPLLATLTSNRVNEYDEDMMERGYYENLMDVSRSNPQLAELYTQRPADWKKLEETDALVTTNDFRLKEMAANKQTHINGWTISTNRWGMRDREYEMEKPTGTYRIAVLGASTVMGWGVEDGQAFEAVLEERLNNEAPPTTDFRHFEVLNFGINGYSALCNVVAFERKAASFKPDAVFVLGNSTDGYWVRQRLFKSVRAGIEPPYDYLKRVVASARVDANTPEQAALWRLNSHGHDLAAWGYSELARQVRAAGAVPVWFLIPRVQGSESKQATVTSLVAAAKDGGHVVIPLDHVFKGQDAKTLIVAPWDAHPNARGHQLIADALYRALCGEIGHRVFAKRSNQGEQ